MWTYIFVMQFFFFAEKWTISFLAKFMGAVTYANYGAVLVYPTVLSLYIISFFSDDLAESGSILDDGTDVLSFNDAYYTLLISSFFYSFTVYVQFRYADKIAAYLQLLEDQYEDTVFLP